MDTIDRIEQTLDTLRPYIASHRGQVEVVDFDEGDGRAAAAARRHLPRLRRLDGDPASRASRARLREMVPEVKHVEAV